MKIKEMFLKILKEKIFSDWGIAEKKLQYAMYNYQTEIGILKNKMFIKERPLKFKILDTVLYKYSHSKKYQIYDWRYKVEPETKVILDIEYFIFSTESPFNLFWTSEYCLKKCE